MNGQSRPTVKVENDPRYDVCEICNGTGCVDAPYSGSDPCCPECDGEELVQIDPVTAYKNASGGR